MRRTHLTFLSASLFLGALSLTPAALAADEQTDSVPMPPQVQQPNAQAPDAAPVPDADAPAAQAPAASGDDAPVRPSNNGTGEQPSAANNYNLHTIIIDYKEHKVGDVVPEEYRKKEYTITDWQARHLPAPQAGAHWAYINANYIQITDDSGKIVMGKSGDIFFKG